MLFTKRLQYILPLFVISSLLSSGCNDNLAQDLPSLSDTYWQSKTVENWNGGYIQTVQQIKFIDDFEIIHIYNSMVVVDDVVAEQFHQEDSLNYQYDFISKQGVLIDKLLNSTKFEIRGNLLFSYGTNETIVYRKVNKTNHMP